MKDSLWAINIGLEIHAQVKTNTKMFSVDSTRFSTNPNTCVHPVSLGFPGTLPVINKKVVKSAVRVGQAFHCDVKSTSIFSRKNYFYPDLPKGYQISQFNLPLLEGGYVEFYSEEKYTKINLERIHIEEDAGKLIHESNRSLVDFNRAGMPLIEIVSKPEITSYKEAADYAKMVRLNLLYLGVCDGHLQEGSMRFDCNISLRQKDSKQLGTRVEIKNLNSFRFIERALLYEFNRQKTLLEKGKTISQETRLYNFKKNETFSMRSKEEASDYRYFPEPDLPVLKIKKPLSQLEVDLPFEKIKKYVDKYDLPISTAMTIVSDLPLCQYFEDAGKKTSNKRVLGKWIVNEVLGYLTDQKLEANQIPIPGEQMAKLVELIENQTLSSKMAKDLFPHLWKEKKDIHSLIKELGLKRVDNLESLSILVEKVLNQYKEQVEQYKQGKTNVLKFLMGQVMKESKGQADPKKTTQILIDKLKK